MSNNNNLMIKLVGAAIVGAVIGASAINLLSPNDQQGAGEQANNEKKPLYWVAPMDSNYRRDKPGKSPMGMDLIPVYEESNSADEHGPGTVRIAPHVINNLGVRTAQVERKTLDSDIATVGYVQYDQDQLVHIHPRVDGWIEKLYVKAEGNPVEQGQPLYTLYSPQLVNAQEEFLIAVKRNNKSLINAAKARLTALQLTPDFINELAKTGKVKQNITFYSPQSGVVDGLKIREGFYVKPGNTLFSISKLDQVWVEAEVFERDAPMISQGLAVAMTLDYLPGKTWQGLVDYVYPTLNDKNRSVRVRLKFDNPDHQLKPNMYAQINIKAQTSADVLVVPKEAVIRTGKQDRVVLALGDGQFKSIAVDIGRVDHDDIEILSGLTQDDIVVTSAQFLIDSESSKNSDFKRMSHDEKPVSVWMEGEINSVMVDHRMANITHGPSQAWDWPAMTMDFMIGQSVDINALKAGQTLHFEVTQTNEGGYEVTGIHIMSEPEDNSDSAPSATVNGVINAIDLEKRVINISRDAIEKWDRPAATMDFMVSDNIVLDEFSIGQKINFTFEIRDDFVVVEISAMTDMDHSQHINH
ncbi:efflux RND transporter periplasmic adaptor subunit [Thalassotalea sp. LPB0316]|uniref:efflux RND transporter periplasmic adaptor subunit n=1 Tax=Thalassotalea sp. LPB0316 TaxID=2769490 RepID=UPI0018675F6F|nr:efflux RND transporter periplasmic adaptor subunit [Thalassotalea sp. LPB0316]QOL25649.1 efflux RND transporter periplasmic adaptor subunit [Thalassotalea sp. LPB0316]